MRVICIKNVPSHIGIGEKAFIEGEVYRTSIHRSWTSRDTLIVKSFKGPAIEFNEYYFQHLDVYLDSRIKKLIEI